MLPRVPEGRHRVAHGACPERREGEAVGNNADNHKKAPTGAALRAHPPNVAQYESNYPSALDANGGRAGNQSEDY
jgi:hypothetical protein